MLPQEYITCTDANANFLGIFDLAIAPELLFYSYLPIILISLFVGGYVLIKSNFSQISKILFTLTVLFSLFIINELAQWVAAPAGVMYFAWSVSLLLHFYIVATTFYFVSSFVTRRRAGLRHVILLFCTSLPILLLLPTHFNLESFDVDWCGAITGPLWYYLYAVEISVIGYLFGWTMKLVISYKKNRSTGLLPNILLLFATAFFLLIFFASYFIGAITGFFELNLIGPLGMLGFICVLSYIIVKFHILRIRLLSAQVLVFGLISLIGSQFFIVESTSYFVLVLITFVISIIGGFFLVKSVAKILSQKDEIEKLARNLEKVNTRLTALDKQKSEFVSIASHQLRSPLTAIRGYTAMLVDGSYGVMPQKAVEALDRIHESAKLMAFSIEDFLNVSRIESGNMKYELADFNLREQAEHIVDDLRPEALRSGLVLSYKSDLTTTGIVHADIGKTQQILHNLINNSLKYTQKGSITVFVHDDVKLKKLYVEIVDTGIGMSKKTIDGLFEKFSRAENANTVNIKGTGLGLFVAREMARAMKGDITAHSEGDGLGSRFILSLPLIK